MNYHFDKYELVEYYKIYLEKILIRLYFFLVFSPLITLQNFPIGTILLLLFDITITEKV